MSKFFISHPRDNSLDVVHRLADRLRGYFGEEQIVLPAEGAALETSLPDARACDVTIVIVTDDWVAAAEPGETRRIDHADDPRRCELEAALAAGRVVVPVLVQRAAMPTAEQLPESLRKLAYQNAFEVRSGRSFNVDVGQLIQDLDSHAGPRPESRTWTWECAVLTPLGAIVCLVAGGFLASELLFTGMMVDPFRTAYAVAPFEVLDLPLVENAERYDTGPREPRNPVSAFAQVALEGFAYGAGMMLIVIGRWRCCRRKEAVRASEHFRLGLATPAAPKSVKAIFCLGCGLAAQGWGILGALPALALGVLGWRDISRRRGWIHGKPLIVWGLTSALVGSILSSVALGQVWTFYHAQEEVARGKEALKNGDERAAIAHLSAALTFYPRHAHARKLRGIAYAFDGKNEEALRDLDAAIARLPEGVNSRVGHLAESYYCKGWVYRHQGLEKQAQAAFAKADDVRQYSPFEILDRNASELRMQTEASEVPNEAPAPAAPAPLEPAPPAPAA